MAGLVLVVCWGLAVRVSVGFDADVHTAPFNHHAIIKRRLDSTTESQIRNIKSASVIVLAVDPFAFEGLGLKLCKFHNQTSSVTVVARKTSRQISSISEA